MRFIGKFGILAMLVLGSVACVKEPVLNEEASAIRLMTHAEPDCAEVGHVTTNNHWFREPNDVNIYLRNQATQYDANVVLRDSLETDGSLYTGTGRLFRCEDEE